MPNINKLIKFLSRLESKDLKVHPYRCVRARNKNASCQSCADACVSGCISFDGNELLVNTEKCIGCGTCATACPTCAIEACCPNDAELLSQILRAMGHCDGHVVIGVRQSVEKAGRMLDAEKVVAVANLGRIDESLIIDLAKHGAQDIVLVLPYDPDEIDARGVAMAKSVCDSANTLLSAWGSPCSVRLSERFPKIVKIREDHEYDADRRAFLSDAFHASKKTAVIAASCALESAAQAEGEKDESALTRMVVMEDGTLPHFVPDRRERILDALSSLGEPREGFLETRLWGHAVIDADLCTGCRMCAAFCPTGALYKFSEENGVSGVEHTPADCVKCHCCEDICRSHAIRVLDAVPLSGFVEGQADRYVMAEEERPKSNPHSARDTLRVLLGTNHISD